MKNAKDLIIFTLFVFCKFFIHYFFFIFQSVKGEVYVETDIRT